jgi:hypothetical protein
VAHGDIGAEVEEVTEQAFVCPSQRLDGVSQLKLVLRTQSKRVLLLVLICGLVSKRVPVLIRVLVSVVSGTLGRGK